MKGIATTSWRDVPQVQSGAPSPAVLHPFPSAPVGSDSELRVQVPSWDLATNERGEGFCPHGRCRAWLVPSARSRATVGVRKTVEPLALWDRIGDGIRVPRTSFQLRGALGQTGAVESRFQWQLGSHNHKSITLGTNLNCVCFWWGVVSNGNTNPGCRFP